MKNSGTIIVKKIIKNIELPYSKQVCAYCGKWKKLIAIGKYNEETWCCEDCIKSKYPQILQECKRK